MKNLITSALLLLAILLPATAGAYDFEVDGIYYNINGTEASVTYNFTYIDISPDPLNIYTGDVTIPEVVTYNGTTYSVTAIGERAFAFCSVKSVNIPNSVTYIGKEAFRKCSLLTYITIPNFVTSIGYGTFDGCSGLTNVTFSNTITYIDYYAFSGCTGLKSITIPNSVISIGYSAFSGCTGLTSITIPNSVTSIGKDAFANCTGLTSMTIPYSVTSIGEGVFKGCNGLTSIIVDSNNVKYDSRNDCNAIIETLSNILIAGCKTTVIPSSVGAIGDRAFSSLSSLMSVAIPISVTSIGEEAFYGCNGLTNVTIPNSVTYIGKIAFAFCKGLKSLTIPNSVAFIDANAFTQCSGLTDVYSYIVYPSAIRIGNNAFYLGIIGYDYSSRTLHVPYGTANAYQVDENWYPYFNHIVEMDPLHGDVNGDGEVNITDINVVTGIIVGASLDDETMQRADVNGDGSINISDVNVILDIILSGDEEPVAEHEWVDLGLPSGTLWATCNVGANSPEDYGDHFAWGETEPKGLYDWSTYKWCLKYEDVWVKELKKYNENSYLGAVDNKIELDLEDDAAYVNWGPKWRMPTLEQFQELCNCCTWQWTTLNDVNGQLVTGPNGKTIFLPAAGGFSSHIYWQGENGYYWSRTLCTPDKWDIPNEGDGSSHAYIQFFGRSRWHVWYDVRCDGQSVRAVRVP